MWLACLLWQAVSAAYEKAVELEEDFEITDTVKRGGAKVTKPTTLAPR